MKSLFTVLTVVTSGALIAAAQSGPAPATVPAVAQMPAATSAQTDLSTASAMAPAIEVPSAIPGRIARASVAAAGASDAVKTLMSFQDSDVKFDIDRLMDILRDKRHEGWVLAAYPDPKTAQPLIGAGFSLDLPARPHPQPDPLNPNQFLEPSSADLWQAAGLDPAKLDGILAQFHDKLDAYGKKGFRRQIWSLGPQITDQDANALLRIGIVQAALNAKAYCRNFDQLSATQQMAMTQLVYQMGYNLQQFSTFLSLINRDNGADGPALANADRQYWRSVQLSLVQSQWARLYRDRAKAVIAMLDPKYAANPAGAEHSIGTVLRPARHHRGSATLRKASYTRHRSAAARRKAHTRRD